MTCRHLETIADVVAGCPRLRKCAQDPAMGTSADVPDVRQDALLRFLAQPARQQAAHSSGHPVVASAEDGERWLYCFPDDAFVEY
jgi:hypothetical protein